VIERRLTQYAVAIPALGWRLRVRTTANCRFGSTLKQGTPQTAWDSRRYRGAARPAAASLAYPKQLRSICGSSGNGRFGDVTGICEFLDAPAKTDQLLDLLRFEDTLC
jgi:hypothetical protein